MSESEVDSGFMCICLHTYDYLQNVAKSRVFGRKGNGADRQDEQRREEIPN